MIEKRWCVEVWGDFTDYTTDVFYTRKEAEAYFRKIRRSLDSSRFIMTRDKIIDTKNEDNFLLLQI